jgi:aldose 1-epimerase
MAATLDAIELCAGDLECALAPEVGGSLASFRVLRDGRPVDLMRPLSAVDRAARNPIGAAMFPMVPYANRIANNQFTFGGRTYHFASNNPPERFNVHGNGWHSQWSAHDVGHDGATLRLISVTDGAPYRYGASQRFQLSPEALTVTMAIENRGPLPMPFGFGEHPWFIRDPDATVVFNARKFWIEGWDNTASEPIRTPPELTFATPTPLPRARRNNCYGDWDGTIEIIWPSRGVGLRIAAEPIFKHLMFFTDPARADFCLEPQTNAVCAFNLMEQGYSADELGVIVLGPGETAKGTIRFSSFAL